MVRAYKCRVKFRAVHNKTQEVTEIYKLSDFCTEHNINYKRLLQCLAQKESVDTSDSKLGGSEYTIERV